MFESFSNILIATVILLPGFLLFSILSKKLNLQMSISEKILYGTTFWIFLFVSTSVFIGFFSNQLLLFFNFFTIISLIIIMILILYLVKNNWNSIKTKIIIKQSNLPYVIAFFLILHYVFSFYISIQY